MKYSNQQIIAHRGASGLVKFENTIEAFQKAIDVKADAVELDVRKTKDGVIIVVHDELFQDRKISEWNYDELCAKTKELGYVMPTLEDTVSFLKGKIFVDVEVKEQGYTQEIIDIILRYLTPQEFYIRSFKDKVLIEVKKINKNIKTVLLLGLEHPKFPLLIRLSELFPLFRVIKTKCDMVSPHYLLVRFGYRQRLHLIGRPVLVWTVDDEKLMRKLLVRKKIDAIITNYPDKGLEILKSQQ